MGAGEMDLQVILGSFGHWQGGLWLRSLENTPVFAPNSLLSIVNSLVVNNLVV
jgi:hypothetical protein